LTTITFLGERQDIFDPEAAVLVAKQTTERRCSVSQQPVDDLPGPAHLDIPLVLNGVVDYRVGKVRVLVH
jgi:hypothetical protein